MRPRVPREQIRDAVVAALSAATKPMSRAELDAATGYTPVQVTALVRELVELDVVTVEGSGRSSMYSLVPGADVEALPKVRVRMRRGF